MTKNSGIGLRRRWGIWAIGFAASLILNLVLFAKIVVFDLNTPLRPLCTKDRGSMVWPWEPTFEEIEGPLNEHFRGGIWTGRPPWDYRIDGSGTVYISLLDRYRYAESIWNSTTKTVESIAGTRGDWRNECDFIRRIATEEQAD